MNCEQRLAIWLLAALVCQVQAFSQNSRFFRISGPAASQDIAFRSDGSLVWSNTQAGATYTIQTESSLNPGSKWADYVQLVVTQAVITNLVVAFHPPSGMTLVPADTLTIGNMLKIDNSVTNDPDITDANPTNVYVSGFYMDSDMVTLSQWQSVYSYATNQGYTFVHPGAGKAANQPVETVDWYDAVKWCNARAEQAALTPVYYTDKGMTEVYTNGETDALFPNWSADGYRLPTEAEWEKAARGGLIGQRFPCGNTISESLANYLGATYLYDYDLGPNSFNALGNWGSQPFTTPVGSFPANGYDLYDMAGNVQEWCWDWYAATPYPGGSPYLGGADPRGPATGSSRVLRGGSWFLYAAVLRCANRSSVVTTNTDNATGIRCVRGL